MLDFDFVNWKPHIERHIADNGLSTEEVEDILYDPAARRARAPLFDRRYLGTRPRASTSSWSSISSKMATTSSSSR